MKTKKFMALLLTAVSLFTFFLSGCGTSDQKTVRVGSKDFTESLIAAEIYALALEEEGYKVERKLNEIGRAHV